jgi:hypothetical protein
VTSYPSCSGPASAASGRYMRSIRTFNGAASAAHSLSADCARDLTGRVDRLEEGDVTARVSTEARLVGDYMKPRRVDATKRGADGTMGRPHPRSACRCRDVGPSDWF